MRTWAPPSPLYYESGTKLPFVNMYYHNDFDTTRDTIGIKRADRIFLSPYFFAFDLLDSHLLDIHFRDFP
jgi:hypothetical protein